MIPYLDTSQEPEKKAPAEKVEKPLPKETVDETKKDAYEKRIDALEERLGASDKEREARQHQDMLNSVNEAFDKASTEFKVFGKTEELPKFPAGPRKGEYIPTSPAFKARSEVADIAGKLMSAGVDVGEAMQSALDAYKGRNLAADTKRNLIKDLKRKEKKLSAKRVGKETTKTYVDEDERKAEVVRSAARKKGIEL